MDLFLVSVLAIIIESVMFRNMDGLVILGIIAETIVFIILAFVVAITIAYWKIFQKAGEEGWKSLIPIYNVYVLSVIGGSPAYLFLFFFVPLLNIYAIVKLYADLAVSFGKDVGFGVGILFFPVLFPLILAFGKATYQGGTLPDNLPADSNPEGFSASNQQGTTNQNPPRKVQPKPEDPWVTGKE